MICSLSLALLLSAVPEVEAVKVWRGPDGQSVDVLTLKPRSAKKALVRVRSADSEHDGLVLPCSVQEQGSATTFVTRYQGQDWDVFVQRSGASSVFVPGKPEFTVKFDQAATDALQVASVLEAQTAQDREGRFALFQRKAWPNLEKKYQAKADAAVAKLTKPCGRAMKFTFDWGSFGDEVMSDVDVWPLCAPVVTKLEAACGVSKGATVVKCRLGAAFAFDAQGVTVTFTTTTSGATGAGSFLSGVK